MYNLGLCYWQPINAGRGRRPNSSPGSGGAVGGRRPNRPRGDNKRVQKEKALDPNKVIRVNGTQISCENYKRVNKEICSCEYILCRKQKKCKLGTTACTLLNNPKSIDYMNCRAGVNIQGRKDCQCIKTRRTRRTQTGKNADGSPIYGMWMPENITYNGETHLCEGKGADEMEDCDCPTLLCRQDRHSCKDGEQMCRLRRDPTVYSLDSVVYTKATDRDCRCKRRKIDLEDEDEEEPEAEEQQQQTTTTTTTTTEQQAQFSSNHKTKDDL